jgi:hypothetical protein
MRGACVRALVGFIIIEVTTAEEAMDVMDPAEAVPAVHAVVTDLADAPRLLEEARRRAPWAAVPAATGAPGKHEVGDADAVVGGMIPCIWRAHGGLLCARPT